MTKNDKIWKFIEDNQIPIGECKKVFDKYSNSYTTFWFLVEPKKDEYDFDEFIVVEIFSKKEFDKDRGEIFEKLIVEDNQYVIMLYSLSDGTHMSDFSYEERHICQKTISKGFESEDLHIFHTFMFEFFSCLEKLKLSFEDSIEILKSDPKYKYKFRIKPSNEKIN